MQVVRGPVQHGGAESWPKTPLILYFRLNTIPRLLGTLINCYSHVSAPTDSAGAVSACSTAVGNSLAHSGSIVTKADLAAARTFVER